MINRTLRYRLSKSRFLSGLQCLKRLYLEIHSPDLASEADAERQAMLDMGKEVGELARLRFPNGQLVAQSHRQASAALRRTEELVHDPTVQAIFEGAFQWEGTLVRVDVLQRVSEQTWCLIEVKASSKVKSAHYDDLAIQTAVLRGAGIALVGSCLMHLNTQYVYQGRDLISNNYLPSLISPNLVNERISKIDGQLEVMRNMLEVPEPPAFIQTVIVTHHTSVLFGNIARWRRDSAWVYYLPGNRKLCETYPLRELIPSMISPQISGSRFFNRG